MGKELTINDLNSLKFSDDKFGKDSIILISLNKLPDEYKTSEIIFSSDCTVNEKYLIKSEKEVFDSIYETGKEIYKSLGGTDCFKKFFNYYKGDEYRIALDQIIVNISNKFIEENGYPFLVEKLPYLENYPCPQYYEFTQQCLVIYFIEELRKWIFKVRKEKNKGMVIKRNGISFDTYPTQKLRTLFDDFKSSLISLMIHGTIPIFNDDISQKEVLDILNQGLPKDDKSKPITQEELDYRNKFLKVLQRSLIHYVLIIMNGIMREQCMVTKQLPIYNELTEQYRLYKTANSLMGIAYDYLLLNLTALNGSYNRAICEIPTCNNEFEKFGKTIFCGDHKEKEIRRYKNHKHYEKRKYNSSNNK